MLLNFQSQFAPLILDGSKIHTLRKPRKHPPKIGETLYMYTGLRTRNTQLISNQYRLISTQKVELSVMWDMEGTWDMGKWKIWGRSINIDNRKLDPTECTQFAIADGFQNSFKLLMFLTKQGSRLPIASERYKPGLFQFKGTFDLYHWTDLKY